MFDEGSDWETQGPLLGLDDKLYYLPAITKYEMSPAHQKMMRYDINNKTWEEMAPLPEYLEYISAAACDGKIVVKGSTMDQLPDGSPQEAMDMQVAVYAYNPNTDAWSKGSSEGVDVKDTLAGYDGKLILAGGGGMSDDAGGEDGEWIELPATIRYYDLSSGAGEKIADMHDVLYRPQVVIRDGVIYAFDINSYTLERIRDGKTEVLKNAMPEYLVDGTRNVIAALDQTQRDGVLLATEEGILFVGPTAKDGSGDTYILRDGSDTFEPYEKRMSDSKVSFVAAAYYKGKVYVIGSAIYEEKDRIFRATLIDEQEPSDIPKTGDQNDMLIYILLIVIAFMTAVGGCIYRRRV